MSNFNYIASWDEFGLEALFNVTKMDENNVWKILKDEKAQPETVPLRQLILRAQFNPQRAYEIYAFVSPLTEEDIRLCFEHTPQVIVEQIRQVGHKFFSNHDPHIKSKIKIT
jgi:hypothetical protein